METSIQPLIFWVLTENPFNCLPPTNQTMEFIFAPSQIPYINVIYCILFLLLAFSILPQLRTVSIKLP